MSKSAPSVIDQLQKRILIVKEEIAKVEIKKLAPDEVFFIVFSISLERGEQL